MWSCLCCRGDVRTLTKTRAQEEKQNPTVDGTRFCLCDVIAFQMKATVFSVFGNLQRDFLIHVRQTTDSAKRDGIIWFCFSPQEQKKKSNGIAVQSKLDFESAHTPTNFKGEMKRAKCRAVKRFLPLNENTSKFIYCIQTSMIQTGHTIPLQCSNKL